jgi:ABC-type nitrate/sulfonate/bicarbonate transport system ATPase subunit
MSIAGDARSIRVRIARKDFHQPDGAVVPVLHDLDLSLTEGEVAVVFGPSGSGKTTLLNLLAGLDTDFEGDITIGDHHAAIGYVFQEPRLLPWLTVEENLRLVTEDKDGISAALEAVGLSDAKTVFPNRLSLGMARRAALARALAVKPALLILDEPFASLDAATAMRLRTLLASVLEQQKTTTLLVTHDMEEAVSLADRMIFLGGKPATATAELTLDTPRSRRSETLLKDYAAEANQKVE